MLQEYINEMNSINKELSILTKTRSVLNKKYKELQKKVVSILQAEKQQGVKYNDNVILIKEKKKFKHKSKNEKEKDGINLLSKYGIRDPRRVLTELDSIKHGHETIENSLQIINKNKLKNK
jgi:hypothetical protein